MLIPRDNAKDLKDIPAKVLEEINIELVEHMDEVLPKALLLENPEQLFESEEPPKPTSRSAVPRTATTGRGDPPPLKRREKLLDRMGVTE